ncbi:protein NLP1 isoform X2 [Selaginella moellendorffii]|uniref:protein NLP1 isoform X2 n=1 Tax=Selaginella moellendorffii TaxID=88036 RepID=UPI000D1C3DA8|nr:protein NLP1 isoform X2 [Selaginella moellendorffii]|eukprot:XP_024518632.1 protein NLP1 isoform X2 [Selaginella moellendorffii]
MVEFPVGNAEYVRQFLLQYSLLRRKEGFVLRHDSLSAGVDQGSGFSFVPERGYNVSGAFLSKQIGADFSSNGAYSKPGQAKLLQSGSTDGTDQGEPSAAPAKPPKSNAAAQRERTGKLKMSDLAQHFHLPINAAAKELGICPTVLKKICRRNGMRRWPHRKVSCCADKEHRAYNRDFGANDRGRRGARRRRHPDGDCDVEKRESAAVCGALGAELKRGGERGENC